MISSVVDGTAAVAVVVCCLVHLLVLVFVGEVACKPVVEKAGEDSTEAGTDNVPGKVEQKHPDQDLVIESLMGIDATKMEVFFNCICG